MSTNIIFDDKIFNPDFVAIFCKYATNCMVINVELYYPIFIYLYIIKELDVVYS
jgi:hypothetical protein